MNDFLCLCGQKKFKTYSYSFSQKSFEVLECCGCHLAQTYPMPVANEDIERFYTDIEDYNLRLKEEHNWRIFSSQLLKIIEEYKTEGILVDVGCNLGIFVQEASKRGYQAKGIDLSEKAIQCGGKELSLEVKLEVGDLTAQRYEPNSIEILVYQHCFEHILYLKEELREIKRVLTPQGILVIEVPRFFSLWRLVLGNYWYGFCPSQHIWQFGLRGLRNLLKREGFAIVTARTRLNLNHDLSWTIKGMIKRLIALAAWLTGTGDKLVVIARKEI